MPNLAAEEKRKRDILDRLARGPREWQPVTLDENDLQRMKLDEGSAFDDIKGDPALRAAQMEAIDRFGEIADKGYTVAEEAAMQRARTEANRDDASRRASILQQMQMRGGGGGGAELAMQLSSADSAAERESQAALDAAAKGQARGLEAMRQRGSMAASLSDDEWQQKARAAEARDQIQRFNSGLTQNFLQGRATAQNQAGQFNAGQQNQWGWNTAELDYNDAVQDQNRKIAEDQARKEAKRKKNSGMMGTVGAIAGGVIGTSVAPGLGTAAGATLGQQLGSGLGDVYSDKNLKKNIGEIPSHEIDAFIQGLHPKKFDYDFESWERPEAKEEPSLLDTILGELEKARDAKTKANRIADKMGVDMRMEFANKTKGAVKSLFQDDDEGEPSRVGVIAQDLEENPIGSRVVKDTPEGKALDDDNLLGAILASLKRLDEKKRDK